MKIVFHYNAGTKLLAKLEQFKSQKLEIVCCTEEQSEPLLTEIRDADVIWHVLQPLTREILAQAPKLKLIQKIGVGTNTIDVDYAKEKQIAVCNMPGTNAQATAEMALLLILAASRRLLMMDKACRSGAWRVDKEVEESLTEIKGKTVGLLGFGQVASLLAPMLQAIGARVVYHAHSNKHNAYEYVDLNALFQQSDILSLHAALTPETHNIINEMALAQMKQGAILVNTARGALVDELAVYAALLTGKLGAAGFDVFGLEPVSAENRLLTLDNVVVAPHLGWLTEETLNRSIEVAVRNCLKLMRGETLEFRVV